VQAVQQMGYQAEHLPYGCDPDVHRRVTLTDEEWQRFHSDVCYVGRRDEREEWLVRLTSNAHLLKIWGYGWDKTPFTALRPHIAGGALNEEEMVKAFNAAKIVLNLQPIATHHRCQTTRPMKSQGCGAFQLTDFKAGSGRDV
jgi:spore maturation protein CgeB